MMFFGSDVLVMLKNFRICWFRGRFGGGKTLASVACAKWLLDAGYVDRVWSNIPVKFAEGPSVAKCYRVAILFDESWIELDNRKFASNDVVAWGAFLRKNEMYLLLPSVWPVDVRFRALSVERLWNLAAWGIPLWVYRWECDFGYTQENGVFGLSSPSSWYAAYDHLALPTSSAGILDVLRQSMARQAGSLDGNPNGDIELYHLPGEVPAAPGSRVAADGAPGDFVLSQDVYPKPVVRSRR